MPRSTRSARLSQGLLVGGAVVVVVLVLLFSHLFESARLGFTNVYFVSAPTSGDIVIVALDDASVQAYGRSPSQWPRTVYVDLINRLNSAGARVIAFDLLFDTSTQDDAAFAAAIQAARDSDARTRMVMADVGVQVGSSVQSGAQSKSVYFDHSLDPTAALASTIDYEGFVNTFPDSDGVIRRQPSLIDVNGTAHLSFSFAIYSAFLRIPAEAVGQLIKSDADHLQISGHTVWVDQFGLWLQNFFGPASNRVQSTFPVISLRDVVSGNVDPKTFADKIVLVGVINNADSSDLFPVPSDATGRVMTGVEIHANAVETLIQNHALQEQSLWSQVLMVILLGLIAGVIYAQLPWYWTFPAAVVFLGGWFVYTSITFRTQFVIINLFHSTLALVLPLIGNIGLTITAEVRRRQKTEFLLETVVEVSSQQLAIEKILPRIAADVEHVLKTSVSEIWLMDDETLTLAYPPTASPLANICKQVQVERRSLREGSQIAVPILWQQNLLGVVAAQVSSRFPARSLRLLEDLVRQIAPNLDNVRLYTTLKQQNTLIEAVFARSPSAILVLNDQLKLLKSNAELQKLFGQEDLIGSVLFQLLNTVDLADEISQTLRANFQTQTQFRGEIQIKSSTYTLDAAPLTEYGEWVVLLTDISAIAELSKLKTRLIRMASHDLRNPLGSIIGYVSLIQETSEGDDVLSPRNQQFLGHILRGANMMTQIITDILSLEQLRSGGVQMTPVDMRSVVDQVIADHRFQIEQKHQALVTELQEQVPPVEGNQGHLTQAITNLVTNAIKYTPEGGRITIRLNQRADQYLQIEVEDTGYGIAEEAQAQLFTEFYRVWSRETEGIPGTGLGLSLVKSVVEVHRGRVWVKSQQGAGSTFFVELPISN